MKKRITATLGLCILIVCILTGCNAKNEEIRLISKCSGVWMNDRPQNISDLHGYAVTDLDHNGSPELLAAVNGGKENNTSCRFYEVNSEKTDINECEYEGITEELMADLMVDKTECYKDKSTGIYYYVFTDTLTKSIRETYETKVAISLFEGKVTQQKLAQKSTIYEGESETPTVTYTNASGVEINESEYKNIAGALFSDCEKLTAEFGWKGYTESNFSNLESLNQSDMVSLLSDSFNKFKVS